MKLIVYNTPFHWRQLFIIMSNIQLNFFFASSLSSLSAATIAFITLKKIKWVCARYIYKRHYSFACFHRFHVFDESHIVRAAGVVTMRLIKIVHWIKRCVCLLFANKVICLGIFAIKLNVTHLYLFFLSLFLSAYCFSSL